MHSNAARSMAAKCPTGVLDRDRLLLRRSFASPGVPTSPSEVPSGVPTRTPAARVPVPVPEPRPRDVVPSPGLLHARATPLGEETRARLALASVSARAVTVFPSPGSSHNNPPGASG